MPGLTLTRYEGEKIAIGPDILITVKHTSGRWVALTIEAPADVPVWRTELLTPAAPPTRTPPNPQLRRRR
jgi:carbon storage regulator CsrA